MNLHSKRTAKEPTRISKIINSMLTPKEQQLTDEIWELEVSKLKAYEQWRDENAEIVKQLDAKKQELNLLLAQSLVNEGENTV